MGVLSDGAATANAAQWLIALETIAERGGWDAGDRLAVSMLIATEMAVRAVGPSAAITYFRDHADALARAHNDRATI